MINFFLKNQKNKTNQKINNWFKKKEKVDLIGQNKTLILIILAIGCIGYFSFEYLSPTEKSTYLQDFKNDLDKMTTKEDTLVNILDL